MSWEVKLQQLDKRLGMVIIHLHEPDSRAEHKLQIMVGHDACPHCGHLTLKTNTGDLDPRALLAEEMKLLEASHAQQDAFARKHGIPLRRVTGTAR